MFPVLLHPELYRRLRRESRALRSRVQKTLDRLRAGRWGGGTRVKRLRGVPHAVYEARTDRGDRLLFTLGRFALDAGGSMGLLTPHLQVWDLVEHDDVERAARRNRAPGAEFLAFATLDELEIDDPPPHPDAPWSAFGGGEADLLLHFLFPDTDTGAGGAPGDRGEERGAQRWFRVDDPWLSTDDEFQRLLDRGGDELELKLGSEQYRILQAPGPLLVAGGAGSGKTTVALHRLLQASLTPHAGAAAYLSYSGPLVEKARRLFTDLVAATPELADEADGGAAATPPRFLTFDDLYRSLIRRERLPRVARPLGEEEFAEWFRRVERTLDPALVWEELRGIVKGACLSLQPGAMLGRDEYFELGRKRAPLFVDLRPEVYRIAERYRDWLAREGRVDSIDLSRLALAEIRRRGRGPYQVVVCDEVQDLTEIEVGCVLALSARADLAGVMLTGDVRQIVNPSGFRWAEVRRLATLRPRRSARVAPPALLRLACNRRATRPLAEVAGALLQLRTAVFGRGDDPMPEPSPGAGPMPVQMLGDAAEAAAAVAELGAGCIVLTLDAASAAELRQHLGTSRVLSVQEAKGLEFDTVVAWNLLTPDADLVDRYLRAAGIASAARAPDAAPPTAGSGDLAAARLDREARFDRLLRLLYVAVTRARRQLAIYEGGVAHPFWSRGALAERMEAQPAAAVAHLFRSTATPAEWEREGEYFLDHGHPRQAAECFRRAGSPRREAAALAVADEARGDWTAALERWQGLGETAPQAVLLERLGRWEEASIRYREAGREAEARRCEVLRLESRGAWRLAAAAWEELRDDDAAARCWAAASEPRAAAAARQRAAEKAGDWPGAAAGWLALGEFEKARRCFAVAGDSCGEALAAAHVDRAHHRWSAAARAFRRAGWRREAWLCLAEAHELANRPSRAGRLRLRLGESAKALDLFVRAADWHQIARLEPPSPPDRRRLIAATRHLLAEGRWADVASILTTRRQALEAWIATSQPDGVQVRAADIVGDSPTGDVAAQRTSLSRAVPVAAPALAPPMPHTAKATSRPAIRAPLPPTARSAAPSAASIAPMTPAATAASSTTEAPVTLAAPVTPAAPTTSVAPAIPAVPMTSTSSALLAAPAIQPVKAARRWVGAWLPWFLAGESMRWAASELDEIGRQEWRARAMAAEAAGAWSRAGRCWRRAGDPADLRRAAAARERRIGGLADPLRQIRVWFLIGDEEGRRRAAGRATGDPRLALALAALGAEAAGNWDEGARHWLALGRRGDATRCHARAAGARGDWELAARLGARTRLLGGEDVGRETGALDGDAPR
jgi:tetratricopeptide (TPR) repeat protein